MVTRGSFKVEGYYREEDGHVYAISSDGRFVGYGETREEALADVNDLLLGYLQVCTDFKVDPSVPLRQAEWELVPA